jgi:hypothetical protein
VLWGGQKRNIDIEGTKKCCGGLEKGHIYMGEEKDENVLCGGTEKEYRRGGGENGIEKQE